MVDARESPPRPDETRAAPLHPILIADRRPVVALTACALALWFASLWLPTLVVRGYGGRILSAEDAWRGWGVLAFGWVPPGTLAWSANLFFWWAAVSLLRGRLATRSAAAAAVLSLTTFLVSVWPNVQGADDLYHVYGYGWGVVLWLLAIFVMLAAALTRLDREAASSEATMKFAQIDEVLRRRLVLSLLPAAAVALVVAVLAVDVRWRGNDEERERLGVVVFKRGAVCAVSQAEVRAPVDVPAGVLEIVTEGDRLDVPYRRFRRWLEWGVPVVRYEGTDYSVAAVEDGLLIRAVPASRALAATLRVTEIGDSESEAIRASLVDAAQRTVFEQTWQRRPYRVFCPDYEEQNLSPDEAPSRTVLAGFGIAPRAPIPASGAVPTVEGRIVATLSIGETRETRLRRWQESQSWAAVPRSVSHTSGCAAGVGWIEAPSRGIGAYVREGELGWGFATPSGVFYPAARGFGGADQQALCVEETAYVYGSFADATGVEHLVLHKRRLPRFALEWTRSVRIADLPRGRYELRTVEEASGQLTLEVAHWRESSAFRVEVPLE